MKKNRAPLLNLPELTEKDFQSQIIELAERLHWLVYHTYDSRRSRAGFPDLVLVKDRVIFAELKTQVGRVLPAQSQWLSSLRHAGVECYVWRPDELEDIIRILTSTQTVA